MSNIDIKGRSPLFSILIPSWNNLEFLKLCLKSIEKNSCYQHEILIHVNDGRDGTLEWVRSKGYKYVHSEENVGVCWALNGLRPLVTTEYIVYMNDDMYTLPEWDRMLLKAVSAIGHKRFLISSSMIQPKAHPNRKVSIGVADYGLTPQTFREEELLNHYKEVCIPDWKGSTSPPNIVHRDIWDLVGGYSVEFSPGMGSDPDFAAKLWLAGIRDFKGIGASRVYHFMSRSVVRVRRNWGSLQFLRKYGITIRTFQDDILNIDEPENSLKNNRNRLPLDRLRSAARLLYTHFRDDKTVKLWERL